MPKTYIVVPVALYQGVSFSGLRSMRAMQASWPASSAATIAACQGKPQPSKQRDDHELRQRHDQAGEPGGAVDAERDRQAGKAHLAVAFDRLEVVERHDAMRAEAVEQRQR